MKNLIFFPTYNEEGNAASVVSRIAQTVPDADILVVDDLSSDRTREVLARLGNERLNVLVRPGKLGIGTAHLLAWCYALHYRYDFLITMDGDLSHDPAEIPFLLKKLDVGYDLVVGSRYTAGGRCDYTGLRKWISRSANRASRTLSGIDASEFTNSYRAFRVDQFSRIALERLFVSGYSFFFMTIIEANRRGLRVAEVPIHFHNREAGISKIPTFEIFRGMRKLAKLAIVRYFRSATITVDSTIGACHACGCAYSRLILSPRQTMNSREDSVRRYCLFCGAA